MKSFRPGDIKIHSMSLWSLDRSRSISNMTKLVKNIKIYESIMNPVLTAVFTISDAIGLAESFPLIGEEYIEMDIETPGMGDIFTMRFDVIEIRDKRQVTEGKASAYNLYCVSKEFRRNIRPVNEIYPDANPIDTLQKMITLLRTDKEFSTGEGVYAKVDFDLTGLRPLQAIDKVRMLTRNINESSSAFCFFENKHGFNFFSVEQLFKAGKTKIGDKVFFFDSASNHSIYQNNFRQVIGMSRLSDTNAMKGLFGGQLNAKMKTFDMLTGEVTDKSYRDSESSAGFIYADDDAASLRSSSGQVEDGEEPSAYLMNLIDSSKSDPAIHEMIMERSSYVHKLVQQLYRIEIYGDLAINAGDVIEVNIPTSSGLTNGGEGEPLDRRYSGNFMISRLVSNISLMAATPVHSMTCELIKGNLVNG
jgi:hypothetical protein